MNTYLQNITELRLKKGNEITLNNTKLGYSVLALSVNSCLNIGNMIRSAHLNGVDQFFVFGNRKYDKRSAMIAYKFMDIIRINNEYPSGVNENTHSINLKTKLEKEDYIFSEDIFIGCMNTYNLVPIFIEQTKDSVSLENVNWKLLEITKKPCFIFGNEQYGIPKNILDCRHHWKDSFCIEIPQTGVLQSYNVSNSAAIVMHSYFQYKTKEVKDIYGLF
jgi:tRNA G18 (ribose-2'-O)-methylase SpoU